MSRLELCSSPAYHNLMQVHLAAAKRHEVGHSWRMVSGSYDGAYLQRYRIHTTIVSMKACLDI